MFRILTISLSALAILSGSTVSWGQDGPEIDAAEVQTKLREWVKTKQLISQEENNWKSGKATLKDLNQIRSEEIEQLREFGEAATLRVKELAEKRSSFADEKEELRAWRSKLMTFVSEWEPKLQDLLPRIPPPLHEKVEASIKRFENPEPDLPLQNRVRDILLIAQAAVSFDGTLTVDSELREIDGESREVEVLYLGLNRAWYVDLSGSYSGHGWPTAEGWQWKEENGLAGKVREAIDIQRRVSPPAMVTLPFAQPGGAEK